MAKEEKMVTLTIDGVQVSVPPGTMIVDAAAKAGVRIPTSATTSGLFPSAPAHLHRPAERAAGFMPSCFTPVRNGMES